MKQVRLLLLGVLCATAIFAQPKKRFKVLALYENGGHHLAYSKRAVGWLNQLAADSSFAIDYLQRADSISEQKLSQYQLFIQLDYPPYSWGKQAEDAFEKYIAAGKGGWIGFHHATLLGEFDGFGLWEWFYHFVGSIRFSNYIADFSPGKVNVEDSVHPCMRNVPLSFLIPKEEWYTYDKSPRANVHVLASVDESSYKPGVKMKMGDHPVVWTNEQYKARNIYIFMGHDPGLFDNAAYTQLFKNAIFWAAGK